MGKKKLIYGIGIVDTNYRLIETIELPKINGKRQQKILWRCPYYIRWLFMLRRCYSENNLTANPTYLGCSVCTEWLTFSNFKSWMEQQDYEGKQLDKDLLVYENKVYSPETCVFVSKEVNVFMVKGDSVRGKYPLGVSYRNKNGFKFQTQICSGDRKHLGYHPTAEEAHRVWQLAKIERAKCLLEKQTDVRIIAGLRRIINKIQYDCDNNLETVDF